eukprot:Pgem_evm1s4897
MGLVKKKSYNSLHDTGGWDQDESEPILHGSPLKKNKSASSLQKYNSSGGLAKSFSTSKLSKLSTRSSSKSGNLTRSSSKPTGLNKAQTQQSWAPTENVVAIEGSSPNEGSNKMKRSNTLTSLGTLKKSVSQNMLSIPITKLNPPHLPNCVYLVKWLGTEKAKSGDATDTAVKIAIEDVLRRNADLAVDKPEKKNDKKELTMSDRKATDESGRITWAGGQDRFWITADDQGVKTWKDAKKEVFAIAPRCFVIDSLVYISRDKANPKIIAFITKKPNTKPSEFFIFLWKAFSEDEAKAITSILKSQKKKYDATNGPSNNLPTVHAGGKE